MKLSLPFMVLIAFSQAVYGVANDQNPKQQNPSLVYGISHYPPFSIIDDNGYSGRDIELLERLAKRMGIEVEYSPCEWIRCVELVKSGKIDVLTAVAYQPERETFLHYIHPAYSSGAIGFWVRKGDANSINELEDLSGLTVGKEKGAKMLKSLDEDPNVTIYESPEFDVLLKMLALGRIDTVMGGHVATMHLVNQSTYKDQLEEANFKLIVPSSYLVLSRASNNTKNLLPELKKQMQNMMQSGELEYFLNWTSIPEKDQ